MAGLFITGTDTETGKTFVSRLLIHLLQQQGLRVSAMKPVASGAGQINGQLRNEDALALADAANSKADYSLVNPYVFSEPVSPHIAAARAGVEIDLDKINDCYHILQQQSDLVVVEGVGGWYAPLSMHCTVADMAEKLQLPVVLVVGLRLGCLNHALLSAQAIRQSGLPFAGWIANSLTDKFTAEDENIETLQHFLHDIPFLGAVAYQSQSKHTPAHTITLSKSDIALY